MIVLYFKRHVSAHASVSSSGLLYFKRHVSAHASVPSSGLLQALTYTVVCLEITRSCITI
jgi:hypothetical protein